MQYYMLDQPSVSIIIHVVSLLHSTPVNVSSELSQKSVNHCLDVVIFLTGQYCTSGLAYGIAFIGEVQQELDLILDLCQALCNFDQNGCVGFSLFPREDLTAPGTGTCRLFSRIDTVLQNVSADVVSSTKNCDYYTGKENGDQVKKSPDRQTERHT